MGFTAEELDGMPDDEVRIAYIKDVLAQSEETKRWLAENEARKQAQAESDAKQAAIAKLAGVKPLAAEGIDKVLDAVKADALAQAEAYAKDMATLFDKGEPIFSIKRHAAKVDAIKARLNQAVDATDERLTKIVETRKAKIAELQTSDPFLSLSDSDLSRANARSVFIREDAYSTDAALIVAKIDAAIKQNDRVTILLLHRYLTERRAAHDAARKQRSPNAEALQLSVLVLVAWKRLAAVADTRPAQIATLKEEIIKVEIAQRNLRRQKQEVENTFKDDPTVYRASF